MLLLFSASSDVSNELQLLRLRRLSLQCCRTLYMIVNILVRVNEQKKKQKTTMFPLRQKMGEK